MRTEIVEIYSDKSSAAVLRHPGRKLPGVLVQGDTPHSMCSLADTVCREARGVVPAATYEELNDLRNHLRSLLNHYKVVLGEHRIPSPFSEGANF